MRFRPCIDIHNGKVKQIVGGSLSDAGDRAVENYISDRGADWYASLYRKDGLEGGHVILLNKEGSDYYEAGRKQVFAALGAYPGGLQAGGGINAQNAAELIRAGADKVIVTSFVFSGGKIRYDRLEELAAAAGRDNIVLDLSCRKKDDRYLVVTDRWQTFTEEAVCPALMEMLSKYCAEFLVHGVDSEGRGQGIEAELVKVLSAYDGLPVTYAGGIHTREDIDLLEQLGKGKLDFTVGSALDLFGGSLSYRMLAETYGGKAAGRRS